jgi:hypothetical protein
MTPDTFPESNHTLSAPEGMSDCVPLQVFTDGKVCISRWRMTWQERVQLLLTSRVWLWVFYGRTQPPVALTAGSPFVPKPAKE